MHLVSRLRDDADLRSLYTGSKTGKQGRPPKYTGKVNNDKIDTEYFKLISLDNEPSLRARRSQSIVYAAVVNSKALKRNILLAHVTYLKESGKDARKLYFSTDISMDPSNVLLYYRSRFQIEFLYRDGKQHTGMNDSQARSENKLPFHFNASLTSINIAKAIHWLNIPREDRRAFSMSIFKP